MKSKNSDGLKRLKFIEELCAERMQAQFSSKAARNNYKVIEGLVPGLGLLPMIKANGYGHGAKWMASVLLKQKSLIGFGVATFSEGVELREGVPSSVPIHVFSNALRWTENKGHLCERYGLVPVLSNIGDWKKFVSKGWPARLSYELKFNTGMNRLGIELENASLIKKALKGKPICWQPKGILSHLAIAENPNHPLSREQKSRFKALVGEFSSFSKTSFNLGNSSAIWNAKAWDLVGCTQWVRPGISLYGAEPFPEAKNKGLKAVMSLKARVVEIQTLKKGESAGYGAKYVHRGTRPKKIAILSAGYADGIHRGLSEKGIASLEQKKVNFLGIVSMDLSAIEAIPSTKVGDWAEILGNSIKPWQQALSANTIPYELYCGLGSRVARHYD